MKQRRSGKSLFIRLLAYLAVTTMLSVSGPSEIEAEAGKPELKTSGKLAGRLLVAAPRMRDPMFTRTVIFLVSHDDSGAVGLIVNRPILVETASKVLQRMPGGDGPGKGGREVRIQYGGPVQPRYWSFIHSNDYTGSGTVAVTGQISLTRNRDVLHALANGKGPARGFLAVGYAGWGPGQLEKEIRRKDWVIIPPDEEIVFDEDTQTKWRRAMDKRGVDL